VHKPVYQDSEFKAKTNARFRLGFLMCKDTDESFDGCIEAEIPDDDMTKMKTLET
jgi:hypothetical protein